MIKIISLLAIIFCICQVVVAQTNTVYDVVLSGGRVVDPETKLDAIKNVGILNNRIAQISSEPLKGKEIINVAGLVVAPGFIDLHVHGRSNVEQEYQLHDGVTTALELEWGIEHLGIWYETRKSKALINYGASVCWPFERFKAIDNYKAGVDSLLQTTLKGEASIGTMTNTILRAANETISPADMNQTLANIKTSLSEGGIGIGVPIGYLPKTNPDEMYQVYKLAGQLQALVFPMFGCPILFQYRKQLPLLCLLVRRCTLFISTVCRWEILDCRWRW